LLLCKCSYVFFIDLHGAKVMILEIRIQKLEIRRIGICIFVPNLISLCILYPKN
jgi:hypothetical protein